LIHQAKKIFDSLQPEVYEGQCVPAAGALGGTNDAEGTKELPSAQQHPIISAGIERAMHTWQKRDWKQFYELARRPWQRHRPPRPVYPSGMNRVQPAAGFSLSELDDAGVDLDLAERLGLPVDAGRIGAYGPNVTVLRDFVRSSRQPL
jgi:ribosomal protein L13E